MASRHDRGCNQFPYEPKTSTATVAPQQGRRTVANGEPADPADRVDDLVQHFCIIRINLDSFEQSERVREVRECAQQGLVLATELLHDLRDESAEAGRTTG